MEILIYPNEILNFNAEKVEEVDDDILKIIDLMWKTVKHYKGVGLAAPQIGVSKRIIVVNSPRLKEVFINPEIINPFGETLSTEGCLSLPNKMYQVKRNMIVDLKAMDTQGNIEQFELIGSQSIIVQHEIDHLNGILINKKI